MLSLILALAAARIQSSDSTTAIEGVWVDTNGQTLFVGNNRVDWKTEDRYYSAMLAEMPDGGLMGSYLAGKDLFVSFDTLERSSQTLDWGRGISATVQTLEGPRSVSIFHLAPDPRTFGAPSGEARVLVDAMGGSGIPAVISLTRRAKLSESPTPYKYFRALSMDALAVGGKFADKEMSIEIDDVPGRTSAPHGSLTYLGRRYSLSGRRIMGRMGFLAFDDSRLGTKGQGYVVWAPSSDRAVDIRNKDQRETDQVDVFFVLADGSTAKGIHKTLKRVAS